MTLELILNGCKEAPNHDVSDMYEAEAIITDLTHNRYKIEVDEHHYALYNFIISKLSPEIS